MSFDIKNKENNCKYCFECLSKSNVEHVCSSQLLSDSISTLSEMGNEQLNQLETFSLSEVHLKCQDELDNWHKSAINHLSQILNQRLNDIKKLFQEDIQVDLNKYKDKMINQLKTRIIPKLNEMITNDDIDSRKAEQIQNLLNNFKLEIETLNDNKLNSDHPSMLIKTQFLSLFFFLLFNY